MTAEPFPNDMRPPRRRRDAHGARAASVAALVGGAAAGLFIFFQVSAIVAGAIACLALAGAAAGLFMVADRNRLRRKETASFAMLGAQIDAMRRSEDFRSRVRPTGHADVDDIGRSIDRLAERLDVRQQEQSTLLVDLADARDAAESASTAKSQFIANMSHELRTPLNAIIGYATLLQDDAAEAKNEPAVEDLGRVLRAARHLLTLINEILDLSKIEAGRVELECALIDLRPFVMETLTTLGPSPSSKTRLEIVVADDIGNISGDPTRLRQSLLNLLGNALKFTDEGFVRMTVERGSIGGAEAVVFEVSDSGIGMTEEQMARLFETFVQADVSTTRRFGGSGLGLAITRSLVRLMGGDVTVRSEIDVGSTFTLTVPREAVGGVGLSPSAIADPAIEARMPGRKLALVIDDDPAAVDLLQRWLDRLGYAVITASDGDPGLAAARRAKPDLIVLDIHMPRRSGWDVLEQVKSDDELRNTPVVVLTVDDDRRRGIIAGASEYLTKPTTQEDLSKVLEVFHSSATGEILIVDDDQDAGDLIERSATRIGLAVRRAYDGEEGLKLARERTPGVIVLDLSMPRMNGFEMLSEITADPTLKTVPIIVFSALSMTISEHEQLLEAGCAVHSKGVSSPREIMAELKSKIAP